MCALLPVLDAAAREHIGLGRRRAVSCRRAEPGPQRASDDDKYVVVVAAGGAGGILLGSTRSA